MEKSLSADGRECQPQRIWKLKWNSTADVFQPPRGAQLHPKFGSLKINLMDLPESLHKLYGSSLMLHKWPLVPNQYVGTMIEEYEVLSYNICNPVQQHLNKFLLDETV